MTATPAPTKSKRASGWLSSAKQSLKSISGASATASPSSTPQPNAASSNNSPNAVTSQLEARDAIPSSSASLSRKPSSVKANGKEKSGEAATGSKGHGRHGAAVSNDMPAIAPRKIIGAVEDEWPLYR